MSNKMTRVQLSNKSHRPNAKSESLLEHACKSSPALHSYILFLRANNGGIPSRPCIHVRAVDDPVQYVEGFYPLFVDPANPRGVLHALDTLRERLPIRAVPFAWTGVGDHFVLGLAGRNKGKVYFWEHESDHKSASDHLHLVAGSFDAFLNLLEPERLDKLETEVGYADEPATWNESQDSPIGPVSFYGRPLSKTEVAKAERDLACKFPSNYREFLLSTNGGSPHHNGFYTVANNTRAYTIIDHFFGINRDSKDCDLVHQQKRLQNKLPQNSIPIAQLGGSEVFILSFDSKLKLRIGRVVPSRSKRDPADRTEWFAKDFAELCSIIREAEDG